METLEAHARSTIVKYKDTLIELRRAVQFTEERDFDAKGRILGRIESLLSELEGTTIGRDVIKQMYGGYVFPFKEVYNILEQVKTNQINFPRMYSQLNEISKSVPSLAREKV